MTLIKSPGGISLAEAVEDEANKIEGSPAFREMIETAREFRKVSKVVDIAKLEEADTPAERCFRRLIADLKRAMGYGFSCIYFFSGNRCTVARVSQERVSLTAEGSLAWTIEINIASEAFKAWVDLVISGNFRPLLYGAEMGFIDTLAHEYAHVREFEEWLDQGTALVLARSDLESGLKEAILLALKRHFVSTLRREKSDLPHFFLRHNLSIPKDLQRALMRWSQACHAQGCSASTHTSDETRADSFINLAQSFIQDAVLSVFFKDFTHYMETIVRENFEPPELRGELPPEQPPVLTPSFCSGVKLSARPPPKPSEPKPSGGINKGNCTLS